MSLHPVLDRFTPADHKHCDVQNTRSILTRGLGTNP
jgi:hypothetical protein